MSLLSLGVWVAIHRSKEQIFYVQFWCSKQHRSLQLFRTSWYLVYVPQLCRYIWAGGLRYAMFQWKRPLLLLFRCPAGWVAIGVSDFSGSVSCNDWTREVCEHWFHLESFSLDGRHVEHSASVPALPQDKRCVRRDLNKISSPGTKCLRHATPYFKLLNSSCIGVFRVETKYVWY